MAAAHWPYPRWLAHRGGGLLAPENTLAAFGLGFARGYRMFECDVRLSADEEPFLLHDHELGRTTNGRGLAQALSWAELAALDAGSWHSPAHAGEPLLHLETLLEFCQCRGCALNLELKAVPGAEARTGAVVAATVLRHWRLTPPPLLSSFSTLALAAAAERAPALPRALLVEHFSTAALAAARALGCVAMVVEAAGIGPTGVSSGQAAGLMMLCYTVNDPQRAAQLQAWGVAGIITDRIDALGPAVGQN